MARSVRCFLGTLLLVIGNVSRLFTGSLLCCFAFPPTSLIFRRQLRPFALKLITFFAASNHLGLLSLMFSVKGYFRVLCSYSNNGKEERVAAKASERRFVRVDCFSFFTLCILSEYVACLLERFTSETFCSHFGLSYFTCCFTCNALSLSLH